MTRAPSPRHAARRRAARLAAAALVLALTWAAFSVRLVPPLIERAYRQESLPALNAIIAGRALFPVAHYLDLWAVIAQRVGCALLGCAAVLFALSREAVNEGLARWLAPAPPPPCRRPAGAGGNELGSGVMALKMTSVHMPTWT